MLKLEDLSFHYTGNQDGESAQDYCFDLEANAGEIVGLTGRSGSGKSTCLDLIAGFLTPTKGRALINGDDISARPPGQRPVTILFQNNNLFEHLGTADNVALGINPSLRLTPTQKAQVNDALFKVGLDGLAERAAARLSGGEQQRVALARSLVAQKPVLLLDEPFSALDMDTRDDMLALVRRIVTERNLTCLMVTHDVRDCDRVADRRYQMVVDNGNRRVEEVQT
ncbi:MAG: ATP-binding cassette domain-containing protein [Alphaproteobacteria bacterium]|jgi:thiamine transport system ATP-binding protein|nr:ATP-binding cassette domain-containing protein [Alphaproteobacteria bacterium]MBT4019352.1 ATP-binding cassette domain-containing protein [Alphaproteobacteria bacterium]MBT4966682.1 ATP-binding cassette domain-containing protein [Alphaproteobacteria bacterium]MBT5161954.1 ATP-binding cassette domain-containing protein [Alphaproteobacteria bacterium]MBT6385610.1 ATP-binding cassette domain-containing protein [Alphaproteobacteria bacterium]